jgi:hypothetical protein
MFNTSFSHAISVCANILVAPQMRESIVPLHSMPLDSIVISFSVIAMFASLVAALAWGVHQSG